MRSLYLEYYCLNFKCALLIHIKNAFGTDTRILLNISVLLDVLAKLETMKVC